MADPVVGITNGVPTSGTGNITTLGQTLLDGANITQGAIADAAVTAGATGSISAKLRSISRDLVANVVLAAGTNLIGLFKVSDGTNAAAIKAASTAPAAADPALVVAVSPNSWDVSSGTGGTKTQRVIIDSTQLTSLLAAYATISATNALQVAIPTDQVVSNKMQSQSNGTTSSRVDSAASTNATSLKASAGSGVNIDVFNVAAYDVYLKLYNKASAPTVGSDTPIWTIPIKAGTGYARTFPMGKWFSTGIAYAITKLQVDSDTTVVASHDLTGSIDWI